MAQESKKDKLAKKVAQTQRQVDHLTEELAVLQAKLDDPDDQTDETELDTLFAEATESLAAQNAKLAKLTGNVPPAVEP